MECPSDILPRVSVVVIGRNEGERLRRCLRLLADQAARVVYVDSGSIDGSVEVARSLGAVAVALDMNRPFTAARARNAGFQEAIRLWPESEFVQFLDGDCAVAPGWLRCAAQALMSSPGVAVACGRLRERYPEASVYNRLCDIEWNLPVGELQWCGGNAMMRVSAFEEAGGFDSTIIAGEEPELCGRLRARGWKIQRIDAEMAMHDAAMTRFRQWWRRAVRGGHAMAEGAWLNGRTTQRYLPRRVLSVVVWAALLPVAAVALASATRGWSLVVLAAAYLLHWARMVVRQRLNGRRLRPAGLYATFVSLAKFAELVGVTRFAIARLTRRRVGIIEYKTAATASIPVAQQASEGS